MGLTLTTPPAAPAVTLAELKAHLRLTSAREDAALQLYLDAAIGRLDGARGGLNRGLVNQVWTWTLDGFPSGDRGLQFPLDPLVSVGSVQYLDAAAALQTWDPGDYTVDATTEPGWLAPGVGKSWPVALDAYNAVTIVFTVGYGATGAAVPPRLRLAIMALATLLYERRGGDDGEEPKWLVDYLTDYRILR